MNSDDGHQHQPPVGTLEAPKSAPARLAPNVSPARKPAATVSPNPSRGFFDEEEAPKGFKRYRAPIIVGVLALAGIIFAQRILSTATNAPPPKQEVQEVHIMLPPPSTPPPPPPPPQEVKQEEKMEVEDKPQEAEPEPAPQIQTALSGGKGPGLSGLGAGKGNGIFANKNTVDAEKLRRSAYANQAKNLINTALKNNARTRKASFSGTARIWVDAAGRLHRAAITEYTGDPNLPSVIRDEIITGLQMPEPPPGGNSFSIYMRIEGRRPN